MNDASFAGRPHDRAVSSQAALARIRSAQSSLTHSEAAVAALILAAPAAAMSLGIEALARRAGVSTATVLRFCQSLGFAGYKDFKIALAVEMGRSPTVVLEQVRAGDTPM
jgi:RpiR family carbohydrate utilization transcriptional regulator